MNTNNWERLLLNCRRESHAILLLSNGYPDKYGRFDLMYGAGAKRVFKQAHEMDTFKGLAFGHIGYHYKNNTFKRLHPSDSRPNIWPEFHFFEPRDYRLEFRDGSVETNFDMELGEGFPRENTKAEILHWETTETPETYLEKIEEIKDCIRDGVFYEMNFCQSFRTNCDIDPYRLFWELNRTAPNPFGVFYKLEDRFLIGSSPERFLQKRGQVLLSQPIKGTLKRTGSADVVEQDTLRNSEKDRAENVMIVDLVRNDLSRVCKVGSVKVDELCEIYTYPNVHQMISTVEGEIANNANFESILEALFPMGSMTGAPKIEVMKYIDKMEGFRRELYSGSVGYFYRGDFDFNVVIRSLEYAENVLQYSVGGAITIDSEAEEELQECITKASSIRRLFED